MRLRDLKSSQTAEKRKSEQDARGRVKNRLRTIVGGFYPLLCQARWFSLRSLAGLEPYLVSDLVLRAADGSESNICPSK